MGKQARGEHTGRAVYCGPVEARKLYYEQQLAPTASTYKYGYPRNVRARNITRVNIHRLKSKHTSTHSSHSTADQRTSSKKTPNEKASDKTTTRTSQSRHKDNARRRTLSTYQAYSPTATMATPATTATTTGKARSALEQARGEVPTTASKEAGEAEEQEETDT